MPRSKAPRKKRPGRKHVAIPIMPELIRQFEETLRINLAWMQMSGYAKTHEPLDALARVHNVLLFAYPDKIVGPVFDGFARVMRKLVEKQMATRTNWDEPAAPVVDPVRVNEYDLATLIAGVNALMEVVQRADVAKLHKGMQAAHYHARKDWLTRKELAHAAQTQEVG